MIYQELCNIILKDKSILTDELLKPNWKKINIKSGIHTTGHCYAASEALYYLIGKKTSGFIPHVLKIENRTHWFLKNKTTGEILDPTATQFPNGIDYSKGKPQNFMKQSIRSIEIMKRVFNKII